MKQASKACLLVAGFLLTSISFTPIIDQEAISIEPSQTEINKQILVLAVKDYLHTKGSPLENDVDYLVNQKHWKWLIAISRIESQFCKRTAHNKKGITSHNCWGLGGDSNYGWYASYPQAMDAAEKMINKFQARGRWLTIHDMNGSYVVPYSPNWENTTNQTLTELKKYINSYGESNYQLQGLWESF